MRKLKAFTITELMVVALLTIVTAGLAMTAWQIMQQQYLQYGSETEQALQLGQLRMLLERDFTQARTVVKEKSTLRFTYPQHQIIYRFENKKVARHLEGSQRSDSFPFRVENWEAYFQKLPVDLGTTDFVRLQTRLFEQPVSLVFSKTYSSDELMNLNHVSQNR